MDEEEENKETSKKFIKGTGIVKIFSEVSEADYHKIQKLMIERFAQDRRQFVKCTKRASEIEEEEELHKQISLYHTKDYMHSGINKTYNTLNDKIYYAKVKEEIKLIINNCQKCQQIKYDIKPVKLKFHLTETLTNKMR